jgi:DNA processing protein
MTRDLDERLARALLCRVAEPSDIRLARAVQQHGACAVVRNVLQGLRSGATSGLEAADLLRLQARIPTAYPRRDVAAADSVGARLLIPGDAEWPTQLADLSRLSGEHGAVPFALWVRGEHDLAAASRRSVAIVGARASTGYGEYVAAELALGAAEHGWAVVSGGAYGIDGAAHRGALSAGGVTVAVLACGVDVAYPRGHTALIERIATTGLVLSEWPPGCAPMRHRFLVRNRVIAALTAGTVVVEAAVRSGSLSTANRARDLSRHVMSVPGPVTSTMSAGTNNLLKQPEVACVTSAADVVELIGAIGDDLAPQPEIPHDPRDDLDPIPRRVLEAVPLNRAAGPASIARTAGVDARQVICALGVLAAAGFVERAEAGWRVAKRGRTGQRAGPRGT